MITRATIATADPNKVDQAIAFVRDRVQPLVDSLPGSRGLGMWVNRETGDVTVSTVWDDRASLEASEPHVADLRTEYGRLIGGTGLRVQIAEVVLLWQAAGDQPGYWARSSEITVPVDRIDEGVTMTRDEILPAVQRIPGVNTCVLLLDRETGLSMLNVTYRGRAELDAGREQGERLRAGVVSRLGASEPVVREMETVIVGIRGPEVPEQRGAAAERAEQTEV